MWLNGLEVKKVSFGQWKEWLDAGPTSVGDCLSELGQPGAFPGHYLTSPYKTFNISHVHAQLCLTVKVSHFNS